MPGGLLDMFGIDPVANRQSRNQMQMLEKSIAGELSRQRLANEGQLNDTKQRGTNEMTKAQWDALVAHAKTLNISPDTMTELKPERFAIDKKRLEGASTDADTSNETARQRKSDTNRGSELRGMTPLSPIRNPAQGVGASSGNVMRDMFSATNNPALAGASQLAMAGAQQTLQPNPQMAGAVDFDQIMQARSFGDTSARANAINSAKGAFTAYPTPFGMASQGGAVESNTVIPSTTPFGQPTVSQAETFPTFVPPDIMAQMPKAPPAPTDNSTTTVDPIAKQVEQLRLMSPAGIPEFLNFMPYNTPEQSQPQVNRAQAQIRAREEYMRRELEKRRSAVTNLINPSLQGLVMPR